MVTTDESMDISEQQDQASPSFGADEIFQGEK